MTMIEGIVDDSLTEYLDQFKNDVEKLNVVYDVGTTTMRLNRFLNYFCKEQK